MPQSVGWIAVLLLAAVPSGLPADSTAALPGRSDVEPRKYWIFFTGKSPVPGKRPPEPEPGYLTPEARERRRVRGSALPRRVDAPLARRYLDRLAELGVRPVVRSRWFNAVSAYLPAERIDRIRSLSFVRSVRPVASMSAPPIPDPPSPDPGKRDRSVGAERAGVVRFGPRGTRLDYGPSRAQLAAINAVTPLEEGYDGEGVILGFLDTRYHFDHPALRHVEADGRLLGLKDFTGPLEEEYGEENDSYHGLSVSSEAIGNEPGHLIGPAHMARVLAATTEYTPREVNREEDFFVAGLEWLERRGVDVVNSSLGYTTFDAGERSYSYEDMNGDTAVTTRAADLAAAMGVMVVVSAGNAAGCGGPDQPGCWHYVGSPADGDSVIAVGAVAPDSSRASFSSFGPTSDGRIKPDVAAPGLSVRAATRSGYTSGFAGTSAASPLVAAVVAQMLEANPALTPMEVRTILRETAHRSSAPDSSLGWGIVNAGAAVRAALRPVVPDEPTVASIRPNPFRRTARFDLRLPEGPDRQVTLALYDVLGREVARPFVGTLQEGFNTVRVEGTNLPSGVYLYRFSGENLKVTGSVVKVE